MTSVRGHVYKFELSQLSKKKTMIMSQKNTIIPEDRAFFCSELIAKAYKVVKLMAPTDEASSNFLPSAFTSEA